MKKNKIFVFLIIIIFFLACYLRFYRLDDLTSPYWEEVALAYDSYSLLKTGRDHHGNSWPIVALESFGDYKSSFYFYAAIPFIKMFGLRVLAIRLPSFLAGLALVFGTATLALQLLNLSNTNKFNLFNRRLLFLLTLFVTSISPWAIFFSRAAWESNLATALLIWGINLFLIYQKQKNKKCFYYLPISILLLILASYCYHAQKVTAPLVGLLLLFTYFYSLKKNNEKLARWEILNLILSLFMGFLLFLPLWQSSKNISGQQRFIETSIFSDLEPIKYSNQKKAENDNALWARLYYHRYLLFAKEIFINFTDHWQLDYLIISGDANPRHNSQITGQIYHLDIVFLFIGLIFLKSQGYFLLIWSIIYLIVAILPSALTTSTPHALRSLAAMPMILVLISMGLWHIIIKIKNNKKFRTIFFILIFYYLIELTIFWNYYQNDYFKKYANYWQDGYQQLMTSLGKLDNNKKKIYVSREQGRPAIFAWFYNQTDPKLVQEFNNQAKKDQGEFLTFYNWSFIDQVSEIKEPGLVAASPSFLKNLKGQQTLIDSVYNQSGFLVWKVVEYQP